MVIETIPELSRQNISSLTGERVDSKTSPTKPVPEEELELAMNIPNPKTLLEQGTIIESHPGTDILELPVERYLFGEFNMKKPEDRKRFETEASGEVKLEYARHKKITAKTGTAPRQRIAVQTLPTWEQSLKKPIIKEPKSSQVVFKNNNFISQKIA